MAIAATVLASGNDTTDGTSFATASISPAANSLLLVFTASSDSTLAPTITTSGLSLTWTQQKDQPFGSSTTDVRRLAAFTAQCGATPGSGAITFTMSATSTHCAWVVVEITGHDTSAPVPQVVGGKDDSTSATGLTLTLAAPVDANSRPFSWWGVRDNVNGTPAASWTELYDEVVASPSMGHEAQWRSDAFDTSPSVTWDLPQRVGGIALEVAVAGAGGTSAEVIAVAVTATADMVVPVVTGETSVTAAEWAQATAQAHAPVVTASGATVVLAVPAQATAAALVPTLANITNASVAAVLATATAAAGTPTVAGITNASVSATLITATAQAVDPTVSVVGAGTVTVPAAAATAQAQAPTVTAIIAVEVIAVVATATAQAEDPTTSAGAIASVVAVTATATALALAPASSSTTTFSFQPPTYWQPAPPPPGVRRSLYQLRESMSVVRINGVFVTVKSPFAGVLTTAGVEGEDFFLGGRMYQVSPEIADELTTAGYTVT